MALADHIPEPSAPGDIVTRLIATLHDDDYDALKFLLLSESQYKHTKVAEALENAGLTVDGEHITGNHIGKFRRNRKKMGALNEPR